ncbi:ABC transporter substrate-binding protein [Bradyrhizobium zhanjiangense]|uniref:ABC transporter substrate-binding protein n=1 Tax=Bradyrhizobium zhanjiangense TaxID=1325107 RepID=UPI0010089665|nr:ABC transporter substrate-binding protein [Bradyrhizobium zhanjiangense]
MNKRIARFSRRGFLAGVAGVIAAPTVLKTSAVADESNSLAVTGLGGSWQEAYTKNVTKPFSDETGISIRFVPSPGINKIKAMQLTGNIGIDVYTCTDAEAAFGSKQGFWEKLDPSLFNSNDLVVPPKDDAVAEYLYTAGIGWDPSRFGPGKHPATFGDFYDIKKFPGRRALNKSPNGTLEAALLADGVTPKEMYPLDLDRAFKMLDRLKPSIATWSSNATQSSSLLQTGEVDFSITFPSRVRPTTEPGGGVPLAFSFDQVTLSKAFNVVVKGTPNKANAMKFIAYTLRPEVQARLQNEAVLTPVSKKAMTMLSTAALKWQPDLTNPNNLIVNETYWADNLDAVNKRLLNWILT